MKKIVLLIITIMLCSIVTAYPVEDGSTTRAFWFWEDCGDPYCSSLSPDYWLEQCGDTTYKHYCGEGKTCENGVCIDKIDSCQEGWVSDYYCSSLSNAKLRQWQNEDCSITTYKWSCTDDEECNNGVCEKIEQAVRS